MRSFVICTARLIFRPHWRKGAPVGQDLLIIEASESHSSDQPVAQTATWQHTTLTTDRPLPDNTQHYRPLPDNTQHYRPLPDNTQHYRPLPDNTQHSQQPDIHAPALHRAATARLSLRGGWDEQSM